MALSCGGQVIKYILFIFNLLFWLTGIVLLAMGIWILVNQNAMDYMHIGNFGYSLTKAAAITVIIVGLLIFLVSGLGCCGACTESRACLTGFAVFLGFILLLQVIAVILAASLHRQINDELMGVMENSLRYDYGEPEDSETAAWNFLQIKVECCGVKENGTLDWINSKWYNTSGGQHKVPPSCCAKLVDPENYTYPWPEDYDQCDKAAAVDHNVPDRKKFVHVQGCWKQVEDWFGDKVSAIIGVVVAIICIQVIIVVLSCVLKKKINNTYEYV